MKKVASIIVTISALALSSCADAVLAGTERCGKPMARTTNPFERQGLQTVANLIRLDASGQLLWNGQPVSDATLTEYLQKISRMSPTPGTVLVVQDGTSCSRVRQVRTSIASSPACSIAQHCSEDPNWDDPIGRIN